MSSFNLPNPPSRSDPANFAPRADAFLGALPTLKVHLEAVADQAAASAAAASSSATQAGSHKDAAQGSAGSAAASAAAASSSATQAGSHKDAAQGSAGSAAASAAAASSSASEAGSHKDAAQGSAGSAAASAAAASSSATQAGSHKDAAQGSAGSAAASAAAASSSATQAGSHKDAAQGSAGSAAASAAAAASSASEAAGHKDAAQGSAGSAAASVAAAASSASEAAGHKDAAQGSAGSAAASATAASSSASEAGSHRAAAESAASQVPQVKSEVQVLGRVAAWQSELQAEVLRGAGQSGLYGIRQYTYGGPQAYDRTFTENWNPASTHNHPNYDITPGTAEFSVVVNGYYLRTRHNDYMLKSPAPVGTSFLDLQKIHAPVVPASVSGAGTVAQQIEAMRSLFTRYHNGEWPEGFGWTMSYVEVWFEPFSEVFQDTFDSFRHQQRITDLDTAFQELTRYNAGGYKDRNENVPFEPPVVRWVEDGKPVLARMRYRIAAVDVSDLGDMRSHISLVDDLAYTHGFGHDSTRWQVAENKNWPGTLDALMAKVPGLDGAGATLTEAYADYGSTTTIKQWESDVPLNAAYYNRFATSVADASNRAGFRRGFNDPTLFVASTTRPEVIPMTIDGRVYRFSYAIPFELILRTPLENWNPYNLPFEETVVGLGTQADPFHGWRDRDVNYRVPAAFYSGGAPGDVADTGMADAWVRDPDGVARSVKGSGIYVRLPEIAGVGNVRLRHHIYPVHQEGSHAYAQARALREQNASALAGVAAGIVQTQALMLRSA